MIFHYHRKRSIPTLPLIPPLPFVSHWILLVLGCVCRYIRMLGCNHRKKILDMSHRGESSYDTEERDIRSTSPWWEASHFFKHQPR
ncbi:hypothetical protein BDV29DRAFT_169173 [Aspergillus leporis]|uniref:Uncharacterized protein n=1 Tax=Aspergillus leporis TaxID=41062 RepID=A0A5N5X9S6_9EURO|nr:hypothetical protein BDV29DRAFT_169173 [Aspergillus leporis]